MALKVEIDKRSGFCGGVIRAISEAERFLDGNPGKKLYSLGAIVHNEAELERLGAKGLVTISHDDVRSIPSPENETLLIRAHGEPPQTYELAREAGVNVIDCTCPVVLKLQRDIREAYTSLMKGTSGGCRLALAVRTPRSARPLPTLGEIVKTSFPSLSIEPGPSLLRAEGGYGPSMPDLTAFRSVAVSPDTTTGQIIIFGKVGHAEVLGLLGQVGGDAVVIENMRMLLDALEEGRIRVDSPLEIFSQTTKSPVEYSEICKVLSERAKAGLKVHQTICSQVASRHEELSRFAETHDVIVFVSGVSSSNGKVLFDLCLSRNPRSHHISSPAEIDPSWFRPDETVGVCGATSTPRWLLEEVANIICMKSGN